MRLLLMSFFLSSMVWSQEKSTMETTVLLGETPIQIVESKPTNSDSIIFLNVHEDETTSIETLMRYSEVDSIPFFYLKHEQTRRVRFALKGKNYDFDPNRIFTKKGIRKTLKDGENHSRKAGKVAKKLAAEVLGRLKGAKVVVALHNNTDVNYSIKSYDVGGDEAQNTKWVYINEAMDADDFIYTTDERFYQAFKERKVNVILQDNTGYVNDGSLSVYCGKNKIPYINIETQKGHFDAQMELLKMVLEIVRK